MVEVEVYILSLKILPASITRPKENHSNVEYVLSNPQWKLKEEAAAAVEDCSELRNDVHSA
jgi:hypothetical protein